MSVKWKAVFAGDVFISDNNSNKIISDELRIFLSTHDIISCNFEAPIVLGEATKISKVGSYLCQSANAGSLIKEAGFNVINLANNHIYDFGEQALNNTTVFFNDVLTVGAGKNFEEAYQLKVFSIPDFTIGFLSFCEAEFGSIMEGSSEQSGYAWVNHSIVDKKISEAKKEVDYLIVQIHAGVEEIELPLPEWRSRYKQIIDLGVDLIIGHHPHVPQGWESYKDKMIFYSLGNFYFDMKSNNPYWNKSFIVSMEFESTKLIKYDIIPIQRIKGITDLYVDSEFENYLTHLYNKLQSKDYLSEMNSISIQLWNERYKNYYNGFITEIASEKSLLKITKIFFRRLLFKGYSENQFLLLLHNIRIESHRWLVQRALSNLYEKH
ncbi:MAG: CapA family protein [Ignavibacteriaceae bacterium]|nr:CapA family protein [Ignavibacterium sp.]MCC6255831.1 CapA family protein [Ignavibacteriaceae bacterium]HMN23756.1 CapA family protein [Ignavibacteriaceae bacterium]HRN27087.1 CapA family protein [Ignavibacteriaceae bacterium]HRP91455.1 CapA family protein [Ignavibacteriaceae bacterium]